MNRSMTPVRLGEDRLLPEYLHILALIGPRVAFSSSIDIKGLGLMASLFIPSDVLSSLQYVTDMENRAIP